MHVKTWRRPISTIQLVELAAGPGPTVGYTACVGPWSQFRIGPIRFLAGWRTRRPEPGLVWFSCVGFFVLCIISVSLVCLVYFAK